MARTIGERVQDWKWWGEQILHLLAGGLIVAPSIFIPAGVIPTVVFTALSVWIGGLREIWQNFGDTDGSLWDSVIDYTAWTLGAILMSLVV